MTSGTTSARQRCQADNIILTCQDAAQITARLVGTTNPSSGV